MTISMQLNEQFCLILSLNLKFMRLGFDTDYVPESAEAFDVREQFDSLVKEEVENAKQSFASRGQKKMQSRMSSMLRAMDRRLSNTEMFYLAHQSMRRFSVSSSIRE